MRGLKHNSFVESYFYNIEGDDPNHPQIEDFLAKVEFNYPRNFKEIENGKIDNDNMSFMSYFTMIQFIRVEVFIKSMQDTFDKVAMYIDGFCGTNEHSLLFKDIVKKQIVSLILVGLFIRIQPLYITTLTFRLLHLTTLLSTGLSMLTIF